MLDYFLTQVQYWEWAHQRITAHLRAEQMEGTRPAHLQAHILAAEQIWLERVEGGSSAHIDSWPELTLDECDRLAAESVRHWRARLEGAGEAQFLRRIVYINSNRSSRHFGKRFETSLGDIFAQLTLHGAYHRGQIVEILRAAGRPTLETDFIYFVRLRDGQL
jgi:uncharacterized damage-inducible protein DinB